MKLEKQQSRKRWNDIRNLWRQWDPIGVMDDPFAPIDEYDSYIGPCLRLLERRADVIEITEYLCYVVRDYMGLGQAGLDHSKPEDFATKLKEWYSQNWPNTSV